MIILFDGDCHLCNRSVQFIIKRDAKKHFRFAALQSKPGINVRKKYNIPAHINSLVLITHDRFYVKSSAALHICRYLNKGWRFCTIFLLIPLPVRNFIYDLIANHRFRLFGKAKTCMLPSTKVPLVDDKNDM